MGLTFEGHDGAGLEVRKEGEEWIREVKET